MSALHESAGEAWSAVARNGCVVVATTKAGAAAVRRGAGKSCVHVGARADPWTALARELVARERARTHDEAQVDALERAFQRYRERVASEGDGP
jgi:sugar (pentulose or hexulose) kinase